MWRAVAVNERPSVNALLLVALILVLDLSQC
jgi:hypothetical protein